MNKFCLMLYLLLFLVPALPGGGQAAECRLIARGFGQDICEDALGAEPTPQKLQQHVWKMALTEKFGAEAYIPTEDEIIRYQSAFQVSLKKSYESDRKVLALIDRLLAENEYAVEDERDLRAIREATAISVRHYETRRDHADTMPPEFAEMTAQAEREVAAAMAGQWKINKLLYGEYGGRIIFQQAGLEPLDAYGAFLDYIRNEGRLEIVDPAYQDAFAPMDAYLAAEHNFLSREEEDIYRHYFEDLSWQFTHRNRSNAYEDIKKRLEAVPVLTKKEKTP